jgi:hypothetical protein
MLEEEIHYFQENQETWKSQYPGKFVLVKGSELIGAYDTMQIALDEGSRRFGLASYLIRRIGEVVEEISIPALTMGILRSNPAHSASNTRTDA